ncbi:hypothetical protein LCGC14_3150340, partial [marine sediment metagenome]
MEKNNNESEQKIEPKVEEEENKESEIGNLEGGVLTESAGIGILREQLLETKEEPIKKEPEVKEEPPKPIIPPKSLVDKPQSLVEQMTELRGLMKNLTEMDAKKLKKKSFKMPFKVKSVTRNLTKMMEKNKVQVLLLKTTGAIQPTIGEINTGRLIVGESYWNAADDITWGWLGKIPTVIACEWDMQPLTKKRLMDDTNALKTWLHPQTIIIRAIEAKEAAEKIAGKGVKPIMLI